MKKILIILLLTVPVFVKAQINLDSLSTSQYSKLGTTHFATNSNPFFYHISPILKVVNGDNKIIAEVDTCGNLKVYGDTTTVLKVILRMYKIKVN